MKKVDIDLTKSTNRLLSLDVFRGITIAGMILVNNPGNWSSIYAPLKHSNWNGLTPTDLVYPFFMFIMGISMYLSYKKFNFQFSKQTFTKLLRRSVLLFLIGLALSWFGLFCRGFNGLRSEELSLIERILQSVVTGFENIRILGVLQRLALVSFIGSLIILLVKPKRIPWIIGVMLLGYWILMAFTNSYDMNDNNLVAMIDRALLGINHMYTEHLTNGATASFEPEGVLSTLPCISHVLLGFLAGKLIAKTKENKERIQKLFLFGTIILFVGFLLDFGFPINKKLWSSSYVLVTCGLGTLFLSLLIWIIDIKGYKRWSIFFDSFGVNPMIIYVLAQVLSILFGSIGFIYVSKWISLNSFLYNILLSPLLGNYFGSLIYALFFVSINWWLGNILYKKKIYIKL